MANNKKVHKLNIFKFWRRVINRWNVEGQCFAPWKLSMPLSVQKMNQYTVRWDDGCKAHAFLTRYNVSNETTRAQNTGFDTFTRTNHNFEIYFVKPYDSTGTQIDNEVDDERDGLIDEILSDMLDCLGIESPLDICDPEESFEVESWSAYPVIYQEDSNYVGWRVSGVISQKNDPTFTFY